MMRKSHYTDWCSEDIAQKLAQPDGLRSFNAVTVISSPTFWSSGASIFRQNRPYPCHHHWSGDWAVVVPAGWATLNAVMFSARLLAW